LSAGGAGVRAHAGADGRVDSAVARAAPQR
jgi:hypothetical protein